MKCQNISTGFQRRSELLPLVSVCFQNDKIKEIALHTHLTLLGTHTHTQHQLCKLCQLTIWSEHDHHTQSAHHPDWHRFTEPTLQLPSSSQEYSKKCTLGHTRAHTHTPQEQMPSQRGCCQHDLSRGQCVTGNKIFSCTIGSVDHNGTTVQPFTLCG